MHFVGDVLVEWGRNSMGFTVADLCGLSRHCGKMIIGLEM